MPFINSMHYLRRLLELLLPFDGFLLRVKYFLFSNSSSYNYSSRSCNSSLPVLVFVSGPPRCGTTMLQSALMRHPEICGFTNETNIFSMINPYRADFSPLDHLSVRNVLRNNSSLSAAYMHLAGELCKLNGSSVVVEKTPQHCFHSHEIKTHFPSARFLFIVRDPISCVSSMVNHSSFIPQGVSINKSIMYWIRSMIKIQEFLLNNSNSALLLKYEDICESPRIFSKSICRFLGVSDYDFFSTESIDNSSEVHSFTGKPGFAGINMPPSSDLASSICLDEKSLSFINSKLSQFSINYAEI